MLTLARWKVNQDTHEFSHLWTRRFEILVRDWLQKSGDAAARLSPDRRLKLQKHSSFGVKASGRNTSPALPPLAISRLEGGQCDESL